MQTRLEKILPTMLAAWLLLGPLACVCVRASIWKTSTPNPTTSIEISQACCAGAMPDRNPINASDSSSEKSTESKDCPHCQGSMLTVSASASSSIDLDPTTFVLPVVLIASSNRTEPISFNTLQLPREHGPPTSPVELRVMLTC